LITLLGYQCVLLRVNGGICGLPVIAGDFSNHPIFLLARFADVDAALEEGAIPYADALRGHIPGQGTFAADVYTVAGVDVADYFAKNNYFTGSDVRRHLCIPANRDPVGRQADRPLDVAVDVQPITSPLICRLLPIVAGSALAGEALEAVGLWFAAMDADDSIGSSLVGEGVPGWVCSLLIITALFSILHRHNSVRPISSLLARINATSGRLRVQSLVGDATDYPPGTGMAFATLAA
jgi:hypothetical protein